MWGPTRPSVASARRDVLCFARFVDKLNPPEALGAETRRREREPYFVATVCSDVERIMKRIVVSVLKRVETNPPRAARRSQYQIPTRAFGLSVPAPRTTGT